MYKTSDQYSSLEFWSCSSFTPDPPVSQQINKCGRSGNKHNDQVKQRDPAIPLQISPQGKQQGNDQQAAEQGQNVSRQQVPRAKRWNGDHKQTAEGYRDQCSRLISSQCVGPQTYDDQDNSVQ